ncbi:MAG: hypothetical protein R3D28_17265 [Geminicoccaceae bacterium]
MLSTKAATSVAATPTAMLTRAPDEPGQHVAAELVGAEPVRHGRRAAGGGSPGGDVGIGERQDGGEERDAHDSDDDGEADDGEPVAAEPGPGGGAAGK